MWSAETRQELASGLGAEVAKLDFLREEKVCIRTSVLDVGSANAFTLLHSTPCMQSDIALHTVRIRQMQTAWDVSGFEVAYPSYAGQLLVDGYYIELLVDALSRGPGPAGAPQAQTQHARAVARAAPAAEAPSASVNSPGRQQRRRSAFAPEEAALADALMMAGGPKRPPPPLPPLSPSSGGVREASRLFFHLQDRAVVEEDPHWRVMCLRAMRLLLARYPPQIGTLCPVRFVFAGEYIGVGH